MAFLVYGGNAIDTEATAGKHAVGKDGKKIKRTYVEESKLSYKDVEVKELWGIKFPRGERVEVKDPVLLTKALAMGCFEFHGDKAELAHVGRSRRAPGKSGEQKQKRIEALIARADIGGEVTRPGLESAVIAADERKMIGEEPKRRGRPRKEDAE